MPYWGAGFLAAMVAWVINRFVVQHLGELAIIWVIPWVEEIMKTGIALVSGASLLLTHGVFGMIEAVYDYVVSPHGGIWPSFFGILSHWFYGFVTMFVYKQTSSWLVGIICAGLLHVFWNYAMGLIRN